MPRDEQGRKVIVFDDFTKGEYGQLNPIEYGDRPKTGLWTGANMAVLPDGSLCPQPIPKTQVTTLPGGGLAGAVVDMGMGYTTTSTGGSVIWIKAGNTIYTSGIGPTYTFAANSGTSANALSYIDRAAAGIVTYAITSTNVLEVINHDGGSVAAAGGSPPACATVAVFADRLMLGGTGAAKNRLYFSAAGNFASWPAANYIDVGDSAAIVALVPARGNLLIAKTVGADTTWWRLSGVPGVNAVLRRASRFPGPTLANNLTLLNDGRVGFGAVTAANGTTANVAPATFDGTNGQTRPDQLGWLADTATTEAYRMADNDDLMLKQQANTLIRRRGAWTRFQFPSSVQVNVSNFTSKSRTMAVDPAAGTFHMMNTAGDTFYKWHPYVTRPAFSADTDGAHPSVASLFTLPEWRAAAGEEVCVTAVVVAFKKWDTGDVANANAFGLTTYATGTYPDGAISATPNVSSWTEAAASSSVTGSLARTTFTLSPVWGNGFRLDFAAVRGVAISSVTVVCATRPMPGVS